MTTETPTRHDAEPATTIKSAKGATKTAPKTTAKPTAKTTPSKTTKNVKPDTAPTEAVQPTTNTTDANAAAPTAETPKQKPQRYADASTASQIADRLAKAKEAGFTRPMLMTLSGYTASAIWRAQNAKCHPVEVEFLDALLAKIERGDVKPPQRATTSHASKTTEAVRTLEAALAEKSLAGTRKLVAEALDALRGKSA